MALKIWRNGYFNDEAFKSIRRRKSSIEENVCRRMLEIAYQTRGIRGKVVKPSERKLMAIKAKERFKLSIRLACEIFSLSRSCFHYQAIHSEENEEIAKMLIKLTNEHKRVYRIYCELKLNLRIKPRNRLKREKPEALSQPDKPNLIWSMDFMSDSLCNGKKFRTFNVIDDYNREGLCFDIDFSMPSERVIRSLQQVIEWRGKPVMLRCDNGPENISHKLINWAIKNQITLIYTQPGKSTQNAYIERFNRTAREELLSCHLFETIEEAQMLATNWLWMYNNERPHKANSFYPPCEVRK